MATDGIGSTHVYDYDLMSLTTAGDCLYPLSDPAAAGRDLADVVVAHERTSHGTWLHTTVRMRASESVGQRRPDVVRRALELMARR